MDIEQQLRGILPLRDPGVAFTDGVMARVGNVPAGQPGDSVVRLAEARARKRSRRILLGTVVVIGAAAAMPVFFRSGGTDAPVMSKAVALVPAGAVAAVPDFQVQVPASAEPSSTDRNPPHCVDPDVLNGLLLGAGQTLRISADPPPELTGFRAPRQLAWLGGSERSAGAEPQPALSAVYRTSLVPEAARTATTTALVAAGWKPHATFNPLSGSVFINENLRSDTYCREGKQVNVAARALEGVTYVVLAIPRKGAGFATTCDEPQFPSAASMSALDAYLPRFEMPRDPATGEPVAMPSMSGGGGSDTKRRMNATFTLRDSVDNVARHFARQMAEQGWDADANWSGAGTVGSSWTRQADADTVLQGTLAVSAFAGGRFTVVFHVVRTK